MDLKDLDLTFVTDDVKSLIICPKTSHDSISFERFKEIQSVIEKATGLKSVITSLPIDVYLIGADYGIWNSEKEFWVVGVDGIPVKGTYGQITAKCQDENKEYGSSWEARLLPKLEDSTQDK